MKSKPTGRMKLRLIKSESGTYLCCENGSIMSVSNQVLFRLLTAFKEPSKFKGTGGLWSVYYPTMDEVPGETLAYVDLTNKLIILNEDTFAELKTTGVGSSKYISAGEYAKMYSKSVTIVKRFCAEGKIAGAYKSGSIWFIPEDAPYPTSRTTSSKQ